MQTLGPPHSNTPPKANPLQLLTVAQWHLFGQLAVLYLINVLQWWTLQVGPEPSMLLDKL